MAQAVRQVSFAFGSLLLLASCLGCEREQQSKQGAKKKAQKAQQEAPAPKAKPKQKKKNPLDDLPKEEKVKKLVNPEGREPYDGPTGTVRGVVKATGDAPLVNQEALDEMKKGCDLAQRMFGKTFREGRDRTLADVFVAVTEYEGYVPQKDEDVVVRAAGCAWDARTYGLTFGQALMIEGQDRKPYVPELVGQRMPAQLFALPGGDPVRLPPLKPGRFQLVDSMRLYNVAHVLVVPYATFDVTGLDGKFEIEGVPVGEVKVNALLPIIEAVDEKEVTVKEGETTEVEFELEFDASKLEETAKK